MTRMFDRASAAPAGGRRPGAANGWVATKAPESGAKRPVGVGPIGRRHGAARAAASLCALASLFAAGCFAGDAFDAPTDVRDLRVLAVRLDPPDIELPLHEDASPITVDVSVLIANPSGEPVAWHLRSCSSITDDSCSGDDGTAGPSAEGVIEPAEPGAPPEGVIAIERELAVEWLVGLLEEASMLGLAGTRPAFELHAEAAGTEERAYKRLQISLPDIVYRLALQEAGIAVCDADGMPEGCLDYRERAPNSNPTIAEIGIERTSRDGPDAALEALPLDAPLIVEPGEEIRIVPAATEGSAEEYQTLAVDFEDFSVNVQERTELLIWSWFSTDGAFGRARTEEERTRGAFNVWTAPSVAPEPSGDVWIWLVLRDNRGGVDFTTIHLRVEQAERETRL